MALGLLLLPVEIMMLSVGSLPNFMALLTVSKESTLAKEGNSVLLSSVHVFHGLAGILACVLHVNRLSRASAEIQHFHIIGEWWSSVQNSEP